MCWCGGKYREYMGTLDLTLNFFLLVNGIDHFDTLFLENKWQPRVSGEWWLLIQEADFFSLHLKLILYANYTLMKTNKQLKFSGNLILL